MQVNKTKDFFTDITPLSAACGSGHVTIIKYLLENGASLSKVCLKDLKASSLLVSIIAELRLPLTSVDSIARAYGSHFDIEQLDELGVNCNDFVF